MSKDDKKLIPIWDEITPSMGVQAVIKGLQEITKEENFVLNMDTYGRYIEGACHGCAATCAVFFLVNEKPTSSNINDHPNNGFTRQSIEHFESAVDNLRYGDIESYLYEFPTITLTKALTLDQAIDDLHGLAYLEDVALYGHPSQQEIDDFIEGLRKLHTFLVGKGL